MSVKRSRQLGGTPLFISRRTHYIRTRTLGRIRKPLREIGEPARQDSSPPAPPEGIIEKLIALAPTYQLEIPPPR